MARWPRLLRDHFGLAVTVSTVTRALHRAARQAQPTYAALCEVIRGSPVVAPDETSWKVNGQLEWLWAFATPETTVYQIQPGRGFPQAAAVLGVDYDGVLVRDGWAPYRQFTAAAHQTCVAHLLRRCRDLARDHPRAAFPARVRGLLQQALGIRDRRAAGTISAHGAAVARGHVLNQLLTALDAAGTLSAMQRFAAASPDRSCRPSSAFSSTPPSTPPTGAPSTRCGRPSSTVKSAGGTARPAAPTPSRSSPPCCAPLSNANWMRPLSSATCSVLDSPPSHKPSFLQPTAHPGNQLRRSLVAPEAVGQMVPPPASHRLLRRRSQHRPCRARIEG